MTSAMILAVTNGVRLIDGGVIQRVAVAMPVAPSVEVLKEAEEDAVAVTSGGACGCELFCFCVGKVRSVD